MDMSKSIFRILSWILYVLPWLLLIFIEGIASHKKNYTNYQLWRVYLPTIRSRLTVVSLDYKNEIIIDGFHTQDKVDIIVPPGKVKGVKNLLQDAQCTIEELLLNIQERLDASWSRLNSIDKHKRDTSNISHSVYNISDFNRYESIEKEMSHLTELCQNKTLYCSLSSIGKSHEGRDLTVMSITSGIMNRKGVWLGSLIHSREWITGAVVMRIIDVLVKTYKTNPEVTWLLNNYNFHFLPISNPDGYVYTWDVDRLWRKNRRINMKKSENKDCDGVDLNRNFDIHWDIEKSDPEILDPGGINYRGPSPASEPETIAIQDKAHALRNNVQVWLSYHGSRSYNVLLFPYAWSCEKIKQSDYEDIYRAGNASINAITDVFTNIHPGEDRYWRTGDACNIFYQAPGTTMDYVYGVEHIKYSYVPEINGPTFDPPPESIATHFQQNWIGLVALLKEVIVVEEEKFIENRRIENEYSNFFVVIISYGTVLLVYVFLLAWICCGLCKKSGNYVADL